MSVQHRLGGPKALLLSLILAILGVIVLCLTLRSATAAPAADTVYIAKTIEPPHPDTGGVVSICFTISGVNPARLDVVLAQDVSGA
jgi:hypothetical protein